MVNRITILIIVILGIIFSGCMGNSANEPLENTMPTSLPTSTISPESNQITQSAEQNKINELETKINSMQKQIEELQTRVNRVDILKPSDKNLIPHVPFRLEVKFGEWQSPTVWVFKENSQVELKGNGEIEYGTYRLFPNNNTILIYLTFP